jgi:hypothetical protein
MSRIYITQPDGLITTETTKEGIENHLLLSNPKLYRAAGLTPFGYTEIGRQLGPNGSSHLETEILNGTYENDDFAANAIIKQLKRRENIVAMPRPVISERDSSNAFGGIREVSATSPPGLYHAIYKCLTSKKSDDSSHPATSILMNMMAIQRTHGVSPE